MAQEQVLILTSGGLRSLVAATLTLRDSPEAKLTLLLIEDGRPAHAMRRRFAGKQADHLAATRVIELALPQLYGHEFGGHADGAPRGALVLPQLMAATVAHAQLAQIRRVIWPGSCAGEAAAIANATERLMLIEHLAELESPRSPVIESPLLELTDPQIIELGAQLDVPWRLAWSCAVAADQPCHICPGCLRRRQAFDLAGLPDPASPSRRPAPAASRP